VTQFNVSLDAASLANIYFTAHGDYPVSEFPFLGIYVAEPPTGPVSDFLAFTFGPPWISLADLGDGFSGDFRSIFGFPRPGGIGTWTITPAADAAPVPEPATLLLFGSGLAAIAAKKYRRSNAA
jgi:hypothetical protein